MSRSVAWKQVGPWIISPPRSILQPTGPSSPRAWSGSLGLVPLDELPVAGFGGQVLLVRTYLVDVEIRSLPTQSVEVFAHAGEPYVLLGRDVLNAFRIVLDGPGLAIELA